MTETQSKKPVESAQAGWMELFKTNPMLALLLVLVTGSAGLDMSASKRMEDTVAAQTEEISALRYRMDTVSEKIGDNSERIQRVESRVNEHGVEILEIRYHYRMLAAGLDADDGR